MKICGIVTEYNPFHNGHLYHIKKAKEISECDILIAVMSGNFVQRGEPAIADKWLRTKYALENGVDIVIELPYPFALQSADGFAKGAIRSLQLAGVDCIVFGSETNDIIKLQTIAKEAFQPKTKDFSMAKNFSMTFDTLSSNDILGISYLKALQNTNIIPYTIKRTNQYHDTDLAQSIASATAIRKGVFNNKDISHATVMANELNKQHAFSLYYPLIQTLLTTLSPSYLSTIFLMDEGIENLFIKKAVQYDTLDDFIDSCTSKKYTKSRIQRTLIHLMTQTTKMEIDNLSNLNHIRVLGFNEKGKKHLSSLRKKDVQIASCFKQIPQAFRQIELRACHAYAYPLNGLNKKKELSKEMQPPIYIP